jgi:hypothetical protein
MTGGSQDQSDGSMAAALAETEWAGAPTDPDPQQNLGYELSDWEVLSPSRGSGQVVFLPEDEELLREEAFVIADRSTLCSLDQRR